jgi:hypothetical protein
MATLMHADFYSSLGRFASVSMPELSIGEGIPQKDANFPSLVLA